MRRVLSRLATGSGWVAGVRCGAQPGHGGAGARTTEHAAPQGWRGPEIRFPAAPRRLHRRARSVFLLGRRRAGPRRKPVAVHRQPRLVALFGVGYLHVTTKKILGGNYGFSGAVSGRREQPHPGHRDRRKSRCRVDRLGGRADQPRVALEAGRLRSSTTRSTFRPADIRTAPTTTRVSGCGGTNSGLGPQSI